MAGQREQNLGTVAPLTTAITITNTAQKIGDMLAAGTPAISAANIAKIYEVLICAKKIDGTTDREACLVGDATTQAWMFAAGERIDPLCEGTDWYLKTLTGTSAALFVCLMKA